MLTQIKPFGLFLSACPEAYRLIDHLEQDKGG